jgi:excisionase family DNA binding protein
MLVSQTPLPSEHSRTATPLAYTLNSAAAASGLSRSTLYRHAAAGRLRLVKVGGRTLVDAASLRSLVGAAS